MRTSKKGFAIAIFMVLAMSLSVIFSVGNVVEAATPEAFTINETISNIKKANKGQTVYSKTFYADNTMILKIHAEHKSYDFQDYGFQIKLTGPTGSIVTPSSGDGYIGDTVWKADKFKNAGEYTISLVCGYTGLGTAGYILTGDFSKEYVYTYKYQSVEASIGNKSSFSEDKCEYKVRVNVGKFDAPTGVKSDRVVYRESNNKICKVELDSTDDDCSVEYGKTYTYYVADYNHLSAAAKAALPTSKTEVAVTPTIKDALKETSAASAITIPEPEVTAVSDLGYKKGLMKANLSWNYKVGALKNVTGYRIQRLDSKGKAVVTINYEPEYLFYLEKSIYIPYAGTTKIKVTPYGVVNGKKYFGKGQTISCKSAKISAPGGYVSKISSSKVGMAVYKPEAAKGVQVQQKVGKKWVNVKKIAKAKRITELYWSKNKAGSKVYRFRSSIKDGKKTYYSKWKKFKPKANNRKYTNWSVSYLRDMYGLTTHWYPSSISYSGSKIKVTGRFTSTWNIASASCKVKVTFKSHGKVIGTKTISSGTLKPNGYKSVSFTLDKSKAGCDLRGVSYSVSYINR